MRFITVIIQYVACVLSHVRLFVTLWTVTCQASLSMEFSRQEYQSWLPFSTPGDLSHLEIDPVSLESPAFAGGFFTTPASGKLHILD